MAGFGKNLMYKPLTSAFNSIKRFAVKINSLEACDKWIQEGQYNNELDMNKDGYLTEEDYNILYDYVYGRYDDRPYPIDIRMLVHQKKIIAGIIPYDNAYDLVNEGEITENSLRVCKRWLLSGKTPNVYAEGFDRSTYHPGWYGSSDPDSIYHIYDRDIVVTS